MGLCGGAGSRSVHVELFGYVILADRSVGLFSKMQARDECGEDIPSHDRIARPLAPLDSFQALQKAYRAAKTARDC
jgi:hypothetical protein